MESVVHISLAEFPLEKTLRLGKGSAAGSDSLLTGDVDVDDAGSSVSVASPGRAGIVKLLGEGKSVAYVSEAGTPMIADPGYALAREAGAAGHLVTTAPGASAVPTALSLTGLATDRYLFAGFAPSGQSVVVSPFQNALLHFFCRNIDTSAR